MPAKKKTPPQYTKRRAPTPRAKATWRTPGLRDLEKAQVALSLRGHRVIDAAMAWAAGVREGVDLGPLEERLLRACGELGALEDGLAERGAPPGPDPHKAKPPAPPARPDPIPASSTPTPAPSTRRRAGRPPHGTSPVFVQIATPAQRLRAEGQSFAKIARTLAVSVPTVMRALKVPVGV